MPVSGRVSRQMARQFNGREPEQGGGIKGIDKLFNQHLNINCCALWV